MDKIEYEYRELREQCRQHRKSQKLTAKDVAESIGSYPQVVYDLERGRNIPGMYRFLQYIDSIGLKIELKEK